MKNNEFEELLLEIGKGADVDQEELADALGYAGSAWYEIQQLTKSLAAGYARRGKDLERKNRIIESVNRTLTASRAENNRLRERLAEMEKRGKTDFSASVEMTGGGADG